MSVEGVAQERTTRLNAEKERPSQGARLWLRRCYIKLYSAYTAEIQRTTYNTIYRVEKFSIHSILSDNETDICPSWEHQSLQRLGARGSHEDVDE